MPEIITTIDPRCIVKKREYPFKKESCPNLKERDHNGYHCGSQYKNWHHLYQSEGSNRCPMCGLSFSGDVKTE